MAELPDDRTMPGAGAHERATSDMGAHDRADAPRPPARDPDHVGNYRIVRELGRGGMGCVFLGQRDDKQFNQQVAIKLINRGMDSDMIVRRFQNERQVLATLAHPYIARLLDGGMIPDGRPYFVMEYVEGLPIEEFCARNRLRLQERLELFRKVCAGVHYAHQNLVVHRDLKPGNILVTSDGTPKLVDFGIAKLLNPSMAQGDQALTLDIGPMTPEYASPEQVRGDPITTVSDVYALGVILYELLTGRPPYNLGSRQLAEIERVVCNTLPQRPSTLISRSTAGAGGFGGADGPGLAGIPIAPEFVESVREGDADRLMRRLRGDLDNIVLMALRKEPQRRYASAEQFAEDIRRHLDGLPVIAAPDRVSYRVGKFVRRRKVEVGAGAVVLASIIGVAVHAVQTARVNAAQRDEARVQRDRAERRFEQVRDLARTLMFDVYDSVEPLQGSTPARETLVSTSLAYLDNLSKEVGDNLELKQELAAAYERVGDVQGGVRTGNLGQRDAALASYNRALALRKEVLAARPADHDAWRDHSTTQIRIADTLKAAGDTPGALAVLREALTTREALADAPGATLQARRDLAIVLQELGDAQDSSGDLAGATQTFKRSLTLRQILADQGADDPRLGPTLLRDLSTGQLRMAQVLERAGDSSGALEMALAAAEVREKLLAASPDNAREQRDLMTARRRVGELLTSRGDPAGAAAQLRMALDVARKLASADPANARARRDLLLAHESLGDAAKNSGLEDEALEQYRALAKLAEQTLATDRANAEAARFLAGSRKRIGDVLLLRGEPLGALESYRGYLTAAEEAARAADPADTIARRNVALGHYNVASATMALGDHASAVESLRRAETIQSDLASADPANHAAALSLARTRVRLGEALGAGADKASARAAYEAAVESIAAAQARDPENRALRLELADALRKFAHLIETDDRAAAHAALRRASGALTGAGDGPQVVKVRSGIESDLARLDKPAGSRPARPR